MIIADEQETWTAVAPNLNANDAANDGRAIRWMIVAGGPGTSLLDLGEGEDSNLATGQVMTEMRRRFLRRRQAYMAWLLTDLVLVAWRRYAVAGETAAAAATSRRRTLRRCCRISGRGQPEAGAGGDAAGERLEHAWRSWWGVGRRTARWRCAGL